MALVELSIGGRNYTVACGNGEEHSLLELGRYVDCKAKELTDAMGHISESLLLVMTCLQITDELNSALNKITDLKAAQINENPQNQDLITGIYQELEQGLVEKINNLTVKISAIAQELEKA